MLCEISLKYLYIPRKISLASKKIYSFKTAPHLTANKFLMDFAVTSRSKVRLYKAWRDEKH